MSPLPRRALVLLVMATAACSGGDGDDGAGLGTTSSIAPPVAPSVPAPAEAGSGTVVIGELASRFEVTRCELEPGATDASGGELLRLTGAGTRANGVPFSVDVVRSSSDEAAQAFTDLITYTDTARILQVQRSEVSGEVSDLRDPGARGTLLRVRADGLSATGIAGPPGTAAPEGPGLVGFALDATCS